MGLRLTTKVQVSGWRFLLRRLEHAIVRRDTRMFDDPLQFYSRSIALGIVVAVLILAGAALLAYFKPQGKLGGTSLFTDRATNQLYVLLSGQLHPVYNLTSARLVLGNPANPATVKSSELSKLPMGQTVGIPGAPYATPVSAGSTSIWTLCDTVARADSTSPVVQTAVIAMPLEIDASVSMEKHHLMIGVPRFDGVHSADNLVEAITAGVTQIASQHTEQAPPVRVLPERIHLHELDPNPPGPESDYRTRWEIPIGLRETDLTPAHCHMHTNPHLLIFGAAKSGKTTIAHAIARAICARNSPQQVRFMLADYRSGLLDAVPDTHLLGAGAINRNSASLDEAVQALAVNLKKRLPPTDLTTAQLRSRSWWSGFDVVLLVDDWHMIVGAAGGMPPMAPLAPLLPAAADIGLHIIVTCQMSQAYKATMDKFVGAAFGSGAPTMFLSGEKQEFPSSEFKVKRRPPGQAFLVSPDGKEVIQAPYIEPPEEVFAAPPSAG